MKGKARRMSAWDIGVLEATAKGTRYRLRKVPQSPFIYVRDLRPRPGQKSQFSLAPLLRGEGEHVRQVVQQICALGEADWPSTGTAALERGGPTWGELIERVEQHWSGRLKGSSTSHYRAALRELARRCIAKDNAALEAWVMEKTPGTSPFLVRLETLTHLHGATGELVVSAELPLKLRELHRRRKPTRYVELGSTRGIPSAAEGQDYLDALGEECRLERWCLAMMLCYGLRNHELWWCGAITTESPGIAAGWTLVPGWWRTKSREEHWVWPLRSDWIERYGLRAYQGEAQNQLHRRIRPIVVSSRDQGKPWRPGDPSDPGLCMNNHLIGNWIGRRLRTVLPPWMARVPDTDGRYRTSDPLVRVTPYDLRHAWAVAMATDPAWGHVSTEMAAQAMGHDLAVHRRRYQRWIGSEERRRRAMAAVMLPGA
jgi:hypothetical protein